MSSTDNSVLASLVKHLTIYYGIPTLVAGVVGGVLNIIVFLSLKTFRQSSCVFFLTIMSFVNIGQLLANLLSRILINGWGLNFTESSPTYCKFRFYCLQVCSLTSYSCMCLATIDQFLATSLRPRWQQLFNIKRAHLLSIFFIILWLVHGIPCLIWFNPVMSPRTGVVSCSNTNSIYERYYTYSYTLTLAGILPISITVLFGYLAYRNVRQIPYRTVPLVRRELDKQLTSMVLVQVVHNFIVIVPYISALMAIYTTNVTAQSSFYTGLIYSLRITGLFYYLYFASPFYIYVCVSKRFRQQLFYVLIGIYLKDRRLPTVVGMNQIAPQICSEKHT